MVGQRALSYFLSSVVCLNKDKISVLIRAVITKYRRLGGLNNRNLFFHSSGGLKSKVKMPAGLVSPESFLWLADRFTVSSTWTFLCEDVHSWFLFLFLEGLGSYWIRAPPLWPHLTLNYLFKIQHEFWEDTMQSVTTSPSYLGSILSQEAH